MNVNGTTINGIFIYNELLEYTQGDLVYNEYDHLLYLVEALSVTGIRPDLSSGEYIEYTSQLCIKDVEEINGTEAKFIPTNLLQSVIDKYITGINFGGRLDSYNYSEIDLGDYRTTTIFHVVMDTDEYKNGLSLVRKRDDYIFHAYETTHGIVQEFIDYTTPIIYFRDIQNDTISPWKYLISDKRGNIDTFNNLISQYNSQLQESFNGIRSLEDNLHKFFSYYDISDSINSSNPTTATITNNVGIVNVIVMYQTPEGIIYQDNTKLDVSKSTTILRDNYQIDIVTDDTDNVTLNLSSSINLRNFRFLKIIGSKYSFQ